MDRVHQVWAAQSRATGVTMTDRFTGEITLAVDSWGTGAKCQTLPLPATNRVSTLTVSGIDFQARTVTKHSVVISVRPDVPMPARCLTRLRFATRSDTGSD